MNLIELFQMSAAKYPNRTAIVDQDGKRVTTYRELDALSGQVAAKLLAEGCLKGEAVLLYLDRRMEYIAAELGVLKAGCTFVPILPHYPQERIDYIKKDCGVSCTIDSFWLKTADAYEPAAAASLAETDRAMIIYTSGSTGNPKGIIHTLASLTGGIWRAYKMFELGCEDVYASLSPFTFIASKIDYYSVLIAGGCTHMLTDAVRKDVRGLEDYYADKKITAGFISPQMLKLFRNKGTHLKKIITGSERVAGLCGDGYDLYNLYGSSETACPVCCYRVDKKYENTPIGKPAEGLEVCLLDDDWTEVADGETGEICVRGILADGYQNLPEQTAKVFRKEAGQTVLFRTGDLGRKLPDGNLLYVNRKDWMVKVNGQRVETGEIEIQMIRVPGVENAVVKAFENENGQNYLCGFYVSESGTDAEEIKNALKKKLPEYMVPLFFKKLAAMPKNANGKLDRSALLPPDVSEYKTAYQKPATEEERLLCEGFAAVLRCGTVGVLDDFFSLGGDSINVMKLLTYCRRLPLTPDMVLRGRTPERIAQLSAAQNAGGLSGCAREKEYYNLTDAQMGVYLECVENPAGTMYNIPFCCLLPKRTDLRRFADAVSACVRMHPAFGASIGLKDGTPVMTVRDGAPEVDETVVENMEEAKAAFVRPFDLENGPLYRLALYRFRESVYFFVDVHHLIFDGTSITVFLDGISALYRGAAATPETLSLLDVSVFEEMIKETPDYQKAREYFRGKLEGTEADSRLIPDFNGEADDGEKSKKLCISLREAFSVQEVQQFTKRHKITENTLFLGAFAYTLAKYTGQKDCLFCTVNHGRHNPGLASATGMFVKTLPVCRTFKEECGVAAYLSEIQEEFYETMGHDSISFGELAADYGIASNIMFVYQAEMMSGFDLEDERITVELLDSGAAQADLSVMILKNGGGYEIALDYRCGLYKEETIRNFVGMLTLAVKGMLTERALEKLELLDNAQREALDAWNETDAFFAQDQTIVDLFRQQAAARPEHTAVVYKDAHYTYAQVDDLSDRLAAFIGRFGVGREQVVSTLLPRCEYMAIASLGVLKAGAAYQPLDPTYPMERLQFMMQDANVRLLIADETLLHLIPGYQGSVLLTKDIPALPEKAGDLEPPRPEDLFILLYTSGSTGVPKGCMLEHRNLAAFCHWYCGFFQLSENSKVAAYASYGFDANMMDMYPALTSGACVHIIEEAIRLDLNALNETLVASGVTHIFMTTQIGRAFATTMKNDTLQYLSMGGEKLVPFRPQGRYRCYNLYGPTECTVLATAYELMAYEENPPIGKQMSNMKLYVLDDKGRRMPPGVPGELCVAGYQVSRGYLNRPEKTQEAYTANPFCDKPGYERLYHTGDVVRFLADGNVQFIGRRDGQVKIRGFRIELTEVEGIIRQYPGISDATVVAFDEPGGGKYIAAYVVSHEAVDIEAMYSFIAANKPPYMVPAVTMQIDKIPLNQNMKVNKRALPIPERVAEEIVLPVGETQQQIFDCVADVVGHKEFGVTTDLYRAGLTSIGAVKLNVLLSDVFRAVIKNRDLKEHNTVEKLERFLSGAKAAVKYEKQAMYPLTQTQNGIFVECAANPGSTMYNIPFLFHLNAQVNLEKLKTAIEAVVNAHPYIKTTMLMDDQGDILQKRNNEASFNVEISAACDKKNIVRPYHILGDRLFRAELYDTADGKYLFLDFHHIISDGVSCGIFLAEMNASYKGAALEAEAFSGFEVALEEQQARKSDAYAKAKVYYDSLFKNCDTDFLPGKDHNKETPGVGNYTLTQEAQADQVRAFCGRGRFTMNALFTAAFGFVVGRYVYKEEAVFTTIYNGRNDSRLARTIHMLVKTIPVFCNMDGSKKIADYVRETGDQLMDSMGHDIYSFGEISRAYGIKSNILFAFQGEDFRFEEVGGAKAEMMPLKLDTAKAPLSVDVLMKDGSIIYQVEYRSDLYEERTIAGMMESYAAVVEEFLNKQRISEVCMVGESAKRDLAQYNATEYPVEQVTANILFERQVALYPDKDAIIAGNRRLTFKELNENANRIANTLLDMGLEIEQMVGVMMPRTVDVCGVRQGILKAGGAFLPIDPDYPDERILYILEDSKVPFVIMPAYLTKERKMLLQSARAKVLVLEELLACGHTENPRVDIKPENLCYCIYTSGSTGKPKGVMIEHRNLVNYVDGNAFNVEARAYMNHATVSLAFAAITFDVSILEECVPLYHGITVCMATEEEIHNPIALAKLILDCGVDMVTCTPSFLVNIIDAKEMRKALSCIKVFNIGAEAFPAALYDKIMALGTNALVYNGYGPTETTIGCAFEQVSQEKITIGRPLGNVKILMIDPYRNLLPPGVPGELLILGNGVGRGYVGKPELTAEKFIAYQGLFAYRSGDLARWKHHGKIEFMGRMDNQVKLRGLRVELDEIENVMNEYPVLNSSVVLVKENSAGQFLCGYFTGSEPIDKQNLTCFMQKYLTTYMVPSVLMQLDELPLTNNGKVDKRALPEPDYVQEEKNYAKPVTKLQKELCGIFAMALGIERVGIGDDFFSCGGTSLSASKVAMKCMTAKIPVSYGDLFVHKTVLALERFIQSKEAVLEEGGIYQENAASPVDPLEHLLKQNTPEYVDEIRQAPLGDVLLTGATGFLGAHVLAELIENYDSTVYCLVRKGKASSIEARLKSILVYYFDKSYENLFGGRIRLIEGDITDAAKVEVLQQYDFDKVVNCAACVKHFSADDTLERVNFHGVENLIKLCQETNRALIQISTVSIAGENVNGKLPQEKRLHENELYFGQSITNQYIDTKYRAEKAVLEALADGMRGKVLRVGNLMSRAKDGEFQINSVTNGFMRTLRGYVILGQFPIFALDAPAEFSPIDATAAAIARLATVDETFSVFHVYSSYTIQMADVIEQLNTAGIPVETVDDETFQTSLMAAMADERKNQLISGLIAYLSSDEQNRSVYIDADNGFTTKALYRLGFKWPMPDGAYLKNAVKALETLGFFDDEWKE